MGSHEGEASPKWVIRAFGMLEVVGPDITIFSFGSRNARTLLGRVALSNRPVRREELMELLWPDDFEDSTRPRLRTEIHRLRSVLGEASEILEVDREFVGLNRNWAEVDVNQFERHLRSAQSATDEGLRLGSLNSAIEVFRAELVPHELTPWFESRRSEFTEAGVEALERIASIWLGRGNVGVAVSYARRAHELLPYRSDAINLLMRALAAKGDVPAALSAFERYEDRLKLDLDLAVDPVTRALESEIRMGKGKISVSAEDSATVARPSAPLTAERVFGQEPAIASLSARILSGLSGATRLFTLIGTGGVGKTTVAMETAHRLRSVFKERTYVVRLGDREDLEGMISSLLQGIGATLGKDDPLDAAASVFTGSGALLVLDNFEQLPPEAAKWIEDLLSRAPDLRVIVTSRRPLQLRSETRFQILPLATAPSSSQSPAIEIPAVALFVERARRILPEYEPDRKELEAVAALVQKLHGLPLSIVLAASRIGTYTPAEIMDEFSDVRRIAPVETSDDRQSLAEIIDWTVSLLSASQREVLQACLVFPADWSIAALRSVASPEAGDQVSVLVDLSLVVRKVAGGTGRFHASPAIREYLIQAWGTAPEADQNRFDLWVMGLLRSADKGRRSGSTEYGGLLDLEAPSIEASLVSMRQKGEEQYHECLSILWRHWQHSHWDNRYADRLLLAALSREGTEDAMVAELNHGASALLIQVGRYSEAEERANIAQRIYMLGNDPSSLLAIVRLRSLLAYFRFDFAAMEALVRQGLSMAQELGEVQLCSTMFANLSIALSNLGRGEEALTAMKESLAIEIERRDTSRLLSAKLTYAVILISLRRWQEAHEMLAEVLEQAEVRSDVELQSNCHLHLTTCKLRTGSSVEARIHLDRSTALAERTQFAFSQGVRQYLAALIAIEGRERRTAFERIQGVLEAWQSVGNDPAFLPAVDLAALGLAIFGAETEAKDLVDRADGLRKSRNIPISPHFVMVWEEVRGHVGPPAASDCSESISDLAKSTWQALVLKGISA